MAGLYVALKWGILLSLAFDASVFLSSCYHGFPHVMMIWLFTKPEPFRFSRPKTGARFWSQFRVPRGRGWWTQLYQWPVQIFLPTDTVRGMESAQGQSASAWTTCTDGGAGGQKEREWVLERDRRACPSGVCSQDFSESSWDYIDEFWGGLVYYLRQRT